MPALANRKTQFPLCDTEHEQMWYFSTDNGGSYDLFAVPCVQNDLLVATHEAMNLVTFVGIV